MSAYKILSPGKTINNSDILCLYHMYRNGAITPNDIVELKASVEPTSEGKAPRGSRSKQPTKQIEFKSTTIETPRSEEITRYKNNILQFIKNRANCDKCPLQKNGFLIVSTNATHPSNADIMFINDGASDQEIASQEHFSMYGDLLDPIKIICDKFKLTYAFVNLTMCNMRGATTAAKVKQSIKACEGVRTEIMNTFKARINVLFGEPTKNAFGIKGGRVTKLHGQMIGNNIISVSPDKLTAKTQTILLKSLVDVIGKTKFNKSNVEIEPDDKFKSKMIEGITPDLTLFDIKEINSKMLYIFVNSQGVKKYYIEDMQFPVYVKSGGMAECEYILEEKPDEQIMLNKRELQGLRKALRDNLNSVR